MSLNVSIDDVPFAILEMVKARILAQRQKQQQAKPTAPKGPRPQFRRFGASSKAYRQPRPAALPDDADLGVLSHLWIHNESTPALHSGMVGTGATGFEIGGAYASIFTDFPIGQRHKATIAVGNGSQSIEINYGLPDVNLYAGTSTSIPCAPSEPGSNYYVCGGAVTVAHAHICNTPPLRAAILPAGDGVFILLVDYDYSYAVAKSAVSTLDFFLYGPFTRVRINVPQSLIASSTKGSDYALRAFCCSDSSIREISVPSPLANAFDAIPVIKQSTITHQTNYRNNGQVVTVQYDIDFTSESPLFDLPYGINLDGSEGFHAWFSSAVTPAMFANMAANSKGARQSAIEQLFADSAFQLFPPDGQWRHADTSQGYYQAQPDGRLRDHPQLRYGIWTAEGEEPAITEAEDEDEYYDPGLYESESEYDFDVNPSAAIFQKDDDPALTVIWDWGDPDYCRAMCAALGFTDADLTP